MTPFEQSIQQAEGWIESIDRERDELARELDDHISDVRRAFNTARLDHLADERRRALETLQQLYSLRFRPELMFPKRPMLKAVLRSRRKAATA